MKQLSDAELARIEQDPQASEEDVQRLVTALRDAYKVMQRVSDIHRPESAVGNLYCEHCQQDCVRVDWPCPTAQALHGEPLAKGAV